MSQGPEGQYVTRLVRELRTLPASRWMKQHGGPWQESGICDITGVLRGRFVGIEVKVKGNRLTEKQAAFLESLQRAGALTVLVYTDVDPAVVVKRIVAGTHRLHVTMLAANGL